MDYTREQVVLMAKLDTVISLNDNELQNNVLKEIRKSLDMFVREAEYTVHIYGSDLDVEWLKKTIEFIVEEKEQTDVHVKILD